MSHQRRSNVSPNKAEGVETGEWVHVFGMWATFVGKGSSKLYSHSSPPLPTWLNYIDIVAPEPLDYDQSEGSVTIQVGSLNNYVWGFIGLFSSSVKCLCTRLHLRVLSRLMQDASFCPPHLVNAFDILI